MSADVAAVDAMVDRMLAAGRAFVSRSPDCPAANRRREEWPS